MEIIKDLKIEDYKGIEDLQFTCGSINLIVGPNNTGKSSILESILMSISSLNNFKDNRGIELSELFHFEDIDFKYLIHQGCNKSKIDLTLFNNNKLTLELEYLESGYPQELADDFLNFLKTTSSDITLNHFYRNRARNFRYPSSITELSRELRFLEETVKKEDSIRADSKKLKLENMLNLWSEKINLEIEERRNSFIQSNKLFMSSKLDGDLITIYTIMEEYIGDIPVISSGILFDYNIPFIFNTPRFDYGISELYKQLVNNKKLTGVLDILRNRIEYLEDIREVGGELLVLLENTKEPLPLSFMGDGFKSLLKLSFMAPLVKKGILIFEEPEVYLHPGYFDILAEEIVLNSKESQFFISTHSMELIKSIIKKAEKFDKINSVNILKLRRLSEGYIDREILSGNSAKEEIETIGSDLRGY